MSSKESITLSREGLYKEIWDHSVAAVARKYSIAYGELTDRCKEAKIPLPPAGYWTKVSYGKPVSRIALPDSDQKSITLNVSLIPKRTRIKGPNANALNNMPIENGCVSVSPASHAATETKVILPELPALADDIRSTYKTDTGEILYVRQTLHQEVWSKPFVDVAVQYGVSDLTLKKVCKSLQIPFPTREFWAQLRAEKNAKEEPNLAAAEPTDAQAREKTVARSKEFTQQNTVVKKLREKSNTQNQDVFSQSLLFLPVEERTRVIQAARELKMPDIELPIHKKIIAYKSVVSRWNEKDRKPPGAQHVYSSYQIHRPFSQALYHHKHCRVYSSY